MGNMHPHILTSQKESYICYYSCLSRNGWSMKLEITTFCVLLQHFVSWCGDVASGGTCIYTPRLDSAVCCLLASYWPDVGLPRKRVPCIRPIGSEDATYHRIQPRGIYIPPLATSPHHLTKLDINFCLWFACLWLFSHKSRFEVAMKNIVIAIFESPSVQTRERRFRWVCGLAFQNGEKKRGSFLCSSDMLIAISFEIRKCVVYRRKLSEGHVATPPKSQFRGQGIHTAISLRDLRDASLENTTGPTFELHNSN